MLVELTEEDIQRSHPPAVSMVCAECREKYRSAAHLETRYSTNIALRDLALMVIVAFSLLLLVLECHLRFSCLFSFRSIPDHFLRHGSDLSHWTENGVWRVRASIRVYPQSCLVVALAICRDEHLTDIIGYSRGCLSDFFRLNRKELRSDP